MLHESHHLQTLSMHATSSANNSANNKGTCGAAEQATGIVSCQSLVSPNPQQSLHDLESYLVGESLNVKVVSLTLWTDV